jgi:hypothetical protein
MSDKSGKREKMRKVFLSMVAAAGFLWFVGSALADTLELTGVGPLQYGGIYTGPYTLSVNGVSTPLICDDFNDTASVGDTWPATAYTGTQIVNHPPLGLFGGIGATGYEEVFWLSEQMLKQVQLGHSNAVSAISYAIWSITDPSVAAVITGGRPGDSSSNWVTWASKNYGSVIPNLNDFTVYVPGIITSGPDTGSRSQEFIAVVPLPPSLLLLAPGLLGIVGLRKRVKK